MSMENCLFGVSGASYEHHTSSSYGTEVFTASTTKFDHYSPGAGGGGGGGYVGPSTDPLAAGVGHQNNPYGGMLRENYCWDCELDETECGDLSSRSAPSFCHQVSLMAAAREGGLVGGGERGAECGGGGGGGGVGLGHPSVELPLLETADDSVCEPHMNAAATADALLATSSHHGYLDWKDAPYCQSQCYVGTPSCSSRYTDFCEPAQKPVQTVSPLSQAELLYHCPSYSSNACVGYSGQGTVKAKQFCQSTQPLTRTRSMTDEWRSGPSVPDDAIDDLPMKNCYQTGKLSVPSESVGAGNRVQIPRIHSTSSDLPRSKDPNSTHPPRKQPSTTPNGKRHHAVDASFSFLDETEKKLWEKDRNKKNKHNLIERKRRLNINDKIKELGSLLPSNVLSPPKDSLQNKGGILRASVDYIQHLQDELRRLSHAEQRAREMLLTNKQMKQKFKNLETFVRSAGLFEKYRNSVVGERYEQSPNH